MTCDRKFSIRNQEKGSRDSITIQYTRNDLLNVVVNKIADFTRIKDVPFVINELIAGKHDTYMQDMLNGIFNGVGPNGMRISVYCADQTAYHDEIVLQQLTNAYPWMNGYHIDDVYRAMCECWKVPPIRKTTKCHSIPTGRYCWLTAHSIRLADLCTSTV